MNRKHVRRAFGIVAAMAPGWAWGVDVPARVSADGNARLDLVSVKLRDGVVVRAREGRLTDFGTGALGPAADVLEFIRAAGGVWTRAYPDLTEERLDAMRRTAEASLGKHVADQNLQFTLVLPAALDAPGIAERLERIELVQRAHAFPTGKDGDPTPPNLVPNQRYRNVTEGVGVNAVWSWPGARGAFTKICDVERQWRTTHLELPAMTRLGPVTSGDPSASSNDHGTAVMGVLVARDDGVGTVGSIPEAPAFYAHVYTNGAYNVAAAINNATAGLSPGSVMMIEQQMVGPTGSPVPMEWQLDNYNAIVTAVGNGIVVVEAAGNGGQNLDASIYQTGNGGHYPFLPQNDSGAIMVGAAVAFASPTGVARSRLSFSNYGSTLDLQGWGERVTTLGYGDAYSAEGLNLQYTNTFSGTSSATPIVSSAVAVLESVHRAIRGTYLTPAQVRSVLRSTGLAQTSGTYPATQQIGPMPDLPSAIMAALGGQDCNRNAIPDAVEIAMGTTVDHNGDGVPDECQCVADVDDGSGSGTRDGGVTVDDLIYYVGAFTDGRIAADVDDGSGTGTPDHAVTIDDLLYFLVRLDAGC